MKSDYRYSDNCLRNMLYAGYTLIEILIVLFIISIVTSVALLSIKQNENKNVENFANELTQMVTLAEEQAMLQPTVIGLSLNKYTLQFTRLNSSAGDKTNRWIPLQDKLFNQRMIPRGIELTVDSGRIRDQMTDEERQNNPQIIISTNGDATPFTIYVGKPGEKPRYAIVGDTDGEVTNRALF